MLCIDFKRLSEDFEYLEELVFQMQELVDEVAETNKNIRQKVHAEEEINEVLTSAEEELQREYRSLLLMLQSLDKILLLYSDVDQRLSDECMCECTTIKRGLLELDYKGRLKDVDEVVITL